MWNCLLMFFRSWLYYYPALGALKLSDGFDRVLHKSDWCVLESDHAVLVVVSAHVQYVWCYLHIKGKRNVVSEWESMHSRALLSCPNDMNCISLAYILRIRNCVQLKILESGSASAHNADMCRCLGTVISIYHESSILHMQFRNSSKIRIRRALRDFFLREWHWRMFKQHNDRLSHLLYRLSHKDLSLIFILPSYSYSLNAVLWYNVCQACFLCLLSLGCWPTELRKSSMTPIGAILHEGLRRLTGIWVLKNRLFTSYSMANTNYSIITWTTLAFPLAAVLPVIME